MFLQAALVLKRHEVISNARFISSGIVNNMQNLLSGKEHALKQ